MDRERQAALREREQHHTPGACLTCMATQSEMIAEAVEPWRDALLSLLNVEHAALLGAQSGALSGLDVAYHFDKARALLAGEAARG